MNESDFLIEHYPYTKIGGQHVGKVSAGIKVTHKPSGLIAICDIERSQSKNKEVAFVMIEAGLNKINYNHYAI